MLTCNDLELTSLLELNTLFLTQLCLGMCVCKGVRLYMSIQAY